MTTRTLAVVGLLFAAAPSYTLAQDTPLKLHLTEVRDPMMNNVVAFSAPADELSRKIAQNAEEIRQMYQSAHEERQRSQDYLSREFSETIRGVETYDDPVNDYKDVWISDTGEYLLSNDVNYNPNEHDTINWQRAQPSQAP